MLISETKGQATYFDILFFWQALTDYNFYLVVCVNFPTKLAVTKYCAGLHLLGSGGLC